MLTGVFACDGGDFGGEQAEDQAVIVRRPHLPIAPKKTGTRDFFTTEAYELSHVGWVRSEVAVLAPKLVDVDDKFGRRRFACQG